MGVSRIDKKPSEVFPFSPKVRGAKYIILYFQFIWIELNWMEFENLFNGLSWVEFYHTVDRVELKTF